MSDLKADNFLEPIRRRIFGWKIPREKLGDLVFGQQHILTQAFFTKHFGQYHTIPLQNLPHYRLLRDHLNDPYSNNIYSQYLECSWDYYYGKDKNTKALRREQIDRFIEHHGKVKRGELTLKPISVCQRPDGRFVIVDGNHRAAIALSLGLDLVARQIAPAKHLRNVIAVPDEFFGTKRKGRPYQSIYYQGEEIVKGRRPDMYERIQKIAEEDLCGRSVLDLGCNVGMNCYLAAERGASKVVGVEWSPKIASGAVRLNSYYAAPCSFIAHDLSEKLENIERFDTVFCFSLVAHLKKVDGITETIKQAVSKVLYFEGHADSKQEDYAYVLNKDNFSKIEFLGYGCDGIHTSKRTRPLFRCEV